MSEAVNIAFGVAEGMNLSSSEIQNLIDRLTEKVEPPKKIELVNYDEKYRESLTNQLVKSKALFSPVYFK